MKKLYYTCKGFFDTEMVFRYSSPQPGLSCSNIYLSCIGTWHPKGPPFYNSYEVRCKTFTRMTDQHYLVKLSNDWNNIKL